MPSPIVIGIFEFTMMRTGEGLNSEGWAKLFSQYFPGAFYAGKLSHDEITSLKTMESGVKLQGKGWLMDM